MRRTERLPVEPATIEVLGHRVKADDTMWTGLDWSRAQYRHHGKIAVPWCHPDEQTGLPDDFDCIYAIYPRATPGKRWKGKMVKDVWFEQSGKKWFVVHEYEPRATLRSS